MGRMNIIFGISVKNYPRNMRSFSRYILTPQKMATSVIFGENYNYSWIRFILKMNYVIPTTFDCKTLSEETEE